MGASGVDVSVVIPTYRREQQVIESLGKALARTDISLEVLVVENSPNGPTAETAPPFADPRMRYFKCPEAAGGRPAVVSNVGARVACGRYLYFLDAPDRLEGDSLTALSRALDCAPHAGMAFGAIIPFGEDSAEVRRQQAFFRTAARVARRLRSRMQLVANLLYMPPVLVNSACMVRREGFLAAGGYDPGIPEHEDVDLWMRIARSHDFVYLDRPIVHHRAGAPHPPNSSTHDDAHLEFASRHIRSKYRQQHGRAELLLLGAWAKTTLRMRGL
jgi:GT2 family glycosyltransferase